MAKRAKVKNEEAQRGSGAPPAKGKRQSKTPKRSKESGQPKTDSSSSTSTEGKPLNRSLHAAKTSKQDEFYTQLSDIEKELRHYTKHFKGKSVLCNCDDPRISNFFHFFSYNFEKLKLKKLTTTCYKNHNVESFSEYAEEHGVYLEYNGDKNNNRIPDPDEIGIHQLKGDGDFRSEECVDLLKKADIVVTNPPFSLFREYLAQLMKYKKKFLIIANHNAITYKEVFQLIKENKIWLGCTHPVAFRVPDHYEMREVRSWRDENGINWRSLGNACWFTNLDFAKRHEDLPLYKSYDRSAYPRYDNYDAIEVSTYKDIPEDYDGVMGVPVTFLEHHNPAQFEVVGTLESNDPNNDYRTRVYTSQECREAYRLRFGKSGTYDLNASGVVNGVKVFKRVLIRKKGQ